MPTTRELSWTNKQVDGTVNARINLVNEEDLYFTDQEPEFEITIENNTSLDITDQSHLQTILAIGQGRPEPFIKERHQNFSIPAGGERTVEISGEPLSLEGHGIVGIGRGNLHDVEKDRSEFRFTASNVRKDVYEPLATFTVWDREHYEVVHEQPQRTQQFALFASFGIVFFAVVQLGSVLGYPVIGLIGGIIILGIYWYSGFLGELAETLIEHRNT